MTSREIILECPNCKKQGLVRRHNNGDIFECVYCHHEEDLSKPGGSFPGLIVTAAVAVLLTLLVLGV